MNNLGQASGRLFPSRQLPSFLTLNRRINNRKLTVIANPTCSLPSMFPGNSIPALRTRTAAPLTRPLSTASPRLALTRRSPAPLRTSATLAPPTKQATPLPPPSSLSLSSSSSSSHPSTIPPSASSSRIDRTISSVSSRAALVSRHFSSSAASPPPAMAYNIRKIGAPYTLEHRVYIEKDGVPVSPFHDIPLYADEQKGILNMIVEIPRWSNAKQEISKEEFLNPIKQDVKKGKLRFVRNCFPHKGYLWNYGAFPQTWEDPNTVHPETKAKGDNDPLDVCEIGELVGYTGQIKQVKVLGVMALLDEEETDWKIIVVDVNDPLAAKLDDIEDVERHLPGLLRATNEWFRIYKIPDGKPENQFAFSGEAKNKKYAEGVIRECAEAWKKLVTRAAPRGDINLANTTLETPDRVGPSEIAQIPRGENLPPAAIDGSIDKWFFISGAAM